MSEPETLLRMVLFCAIIIEVLTAMFLCFILGALEDKQT